MRLGIMQPYFAPALGYLDLINLRDEWIVFDTAQYRRHSWMNRNRILHPEEGWQYLTARVRKPSRGTPIQDVVLADTSDWRDGMLRQLGHYASAAPHYECTRALLAASLAAEPRSLARLSVDLLRRCCALLEIPFQPRFFSELEFTLGPVQGPGDWALRISEALGATVYINPPGGESIFDGGAFEAAGIRLVIRRFEELVYQPRGFEYLPLLSIIDVLMWNEVERIQAHLTQQRAAFERSLGS